MNRDSKQFFFATGLRFLTQSSQYFYYTLMPILVVGLHAVPHEIKLTVSIFFFGVTLALIFAGPIIDTFAEMNVFWLGVCVFLIGTLICYFSQNVQSMMVGRFIQGLAVGVLQILSKSLLAASPERTKYFAVYQLALEFAPPTAMLITSIILYFFRWQTSFIFLFISYIAILWAGLRTAKVKDKPPSDQSGFKIHLKTYWLLCKDKRFLPAVFSYAIVNAIIAPFYVTTTYTVTDILHYGLHMIGFITAIFAIMGMLGNFVSIWFEKLDIEKYILPIGLSLSVLGCLLLLLNGLLFPPSLFNLVSPMVLYSFGVSFLYAEFNTTILTNFEQISRNVTLSTMAICVALVSSISTYISSFHHHDTITQTARLMLCMALLSAGLYALYKRLAR